MKTRHSVDSASLSPGMRIGSWRVVSQHGSGSYGVVYRVEKVGQEEAGPFALKVARSPLDPRFEREWELLSRIRHPQVPRFEVQGWVTMPGGVPFPYVVMEWVEGVALYEWAGRQPRTSREVLRVLAQVARALEATHAVDEAGPADDLYALGVTAYRLVAGVYPPAWVDFIETEQGAQLVAPEPVLVETRATVSPELGALINQLLSEEPSARGSALEVAEALEQAANGSGDGRDQPITPIAEPAPRKRVPAWMAEDLEESEAAVVVRAPREHVSRMARPRPGGLHGRSQEANQRMSPCRAPARASRTREWWPSETRPPRSPWSRLPPNRGQAAWART